MNETLTNETLTWNSFSNDIVTEITTGINIHDSIFFIIMYLALVILTYKIFKSTAEINKGIKYDTVSFFEKSFKYYFLYFVVLFFAEVISIIIYFFKLNSSLIIILFGIIIFLIILLPWIGRTYLLESITYKYFEKDLPTKFSKRIFFFFLSLLIAVDFVLYLISYVISAYAFLIYTLVVIISLLYFIYKKEGSLKKITKQIPHLTIILLLVFRLTGIFQMFYEDEEMWTYFEYFYGILIFIIYSFILIKLKKWRRVLKK